MAPAAGSTARWMGVRSHSDCPLCKWARLWLTHCPRSRSLPGTIDPGGRPLSETLLHDIAEFCRSARMAEVHLRAPRGERRQAGQPAAPRRPRHHRHGGPRARLHRPRAAPHRERRRRPPASGPAAARRPHHAQLPLLRQPAEIPAVRHHLRREVGHRPTRRHGARQHPSAPAGAAPVRRRHGRRHGARPDHARDARPLPHHAVLHRRQGDQPRGRAPRAGEDARPIVRASGDRAGDDQHVLFRGAVAEAELGQCRHQPRLARAFAHRQHRARVRDADHRSGPVPRRELARPRERRQRQSGLREAGRAGDLSRGPQVPARSGPPAPRLHRGRVRPGDRLAALSRACVAGVQGAPGCGAAGARAGAGRHG